MDTARSSIPETGTVEAVHRLLAGRRVLVLSGAGVSTESGIPDYRGPDRLEQSSRPMRYQQFVGSDDARRRYWARSLVGWGTVHRAAPNGGHQALAQLEASGAISGIITQNVDGLHQAAGSRTVLELHGSLAAVRCLDCRRLESRRSLQTRLLGLNPAFFATPREIAPDGDAEIDSDRLDRFRVAACRHCLGTPKPDVVFFGENVPRRRLDRAWQMFDEAEALLVVGSSLTVFSGYRFVQRAAHEAKPIAIVNDGPTRGDDDAAMRVSGRLGTILPELFRHFALAE